jgi:zeaxanthin glucosyltransferase
MDGACQGGSEPPMSHFGILSFPGTGHLHPLTALGRELASRNHTVTIFQVADLEHLIRAAGLRFRQIGERDFPSGTLRSLDERLSRLQGSEAMESVFDRIRQNSQIVLRDAPNAIRSEKVDVLIVDQAEFAGGSIAEFLGLPFITAILTLPLQLRSDIPFFECPAKREPNLRERLPNVCRNSRLGLAQGRILELVNQQRKRWSLQAKTDLSAFASRLAQISQLPASFDFPDGNLAPCFHYTGPFLDETGRSKTCFPWSQLDSSRPLVFVSMGTLQNGVEQIFRVVAEACANFPVQTVISLGGGMSPEVFAALPGTPIVVPYAPQLDLLKRAALTIFHGGLNTALESLAHGVPMIAIPVTFDQPGVGARLVRTRTGRMIPIGELTANRLRMEISEILTNPQYRANAAILQKDISAINGVKLASDIIERVLAHDCARTSGLASYLSVCSGKMRKPVIGV